MYNMIYKFIVKGGVYMTELLKQTVGSIICNTPSMYELWPRKDYKKHVPRNAKQLVENNWRNTGNSLRRAMDEVRGENE